MRSSFLRAVSLAGVLAGVCTASSRASAAAADPPVHAERDADARGSPGAPPARHHVSLTLSPYHLGFPIFDVLVEERVADRFGIAQELGFGSYASARVAQLGARLFFYADGSFDGGVQLGPVVRLNRILYGGPDAVSTPPSDTAAATEAFFHDAQVARANGRDSLFAGVFVGAKGILTRWPAARGLTVSGGLEFGAMHLFGGSAYAPSPQATTLGDTAMALLDVRVGWSL
jgi:hypothetical protein